MIFKKSLIIGIGALFILSGCHFTPLYRKEGVKDEQVVRYTRLIRVAPIADEIGQKMRWHLLDLLNPKKEKNPPQYILKVELNRYVEREQGIRSDNTATRATMVMTAKYQLLESKTQEILIKDAVNTRASYNILTAPYATYVARREADENTVIVLSQDIALRITAFFKNKTLFHKKTDKK